MRTTTQPTPLSAGAPGNSAVGDVAAAGSATTASKSDHVHGRESFSATAPAVPTYGGGGSAGASTSPARADHRHDFGAAPTPTTQAFGDTPVVGATDTPATALHKHGMPSTWTKVAAGTLGAVASLDLAALSGYRRYHLIIVARHTNTDGGGTVTVKLNNGAAHDSNRIHITNSTVTGAHQASAATITIGTTINVAPTNQQLTLIDLEVVSDASNSSALTFIAKVAAMSATGSVSDSSDLTFGDLQDASTSITEILVAFGVTLAGGNYVLYGSNEVA